MSLPNLTNNIMQQPQNIVINQVQPITHTIMSNVTGPANNGIPIATAITNTVQQHQVMDQVGGVGDIKPGIMMDSLPMPGASLVNAHPTPVHNSTPSKSVHTHNTSATNSSSTTPNASDSSQVLSKTRMSDLIRDIDPNIYMEDEVEEILLGYVDDFVDRVLNGASLIAKHRHVKSIEVKDVQMFINRNYNMWAPGLGTDELRPYKRSLTTESHKQRLALIRKALKKY